MILICSTHYRVAESCGARNYWYLICETINIFPVLASIWLIGIVEWSTIFRFKELHGVAVYWEKPNNIKTGWLDLRALNLSDQKYFQLDIIIYLYCHYIKRTQLH